MELTFSQDAVQYLSEFVTEKDILVLFYDIEGCGCGVNGVPLLQIQPEETRRELVKIKSNKFQMYMFNKQMVFFDDVMKVDFLSNKLKLSSKSQIFTSDLAVRRKEHP